eukprot:11672147-Alexandrium_andersonii.AAC.1
MEGAWEGSEGGACEKHFAAKVRRKNCLCAAAVGPTAACLRDGCRCRPRRGCTAAACRPCHSLSLLLRPPPNAANNKCAIYASAATVAVLRPSQPLST